MEKLLTTHDLIELLQVPEKTIANWRSSKRIPYRKVNGLVRYDLSEIERWLSSCRRGPC